LSLLPRAHRHSSIVRSKHFQYYMFLDFRHGLLALQSQFDNDQRSERTIAGMRTALSAGKWVHKAPIGYLNSQAQGGLSHDLDRAGLVRKAFELHAEGKHSKPAVLKLVTDLGLKMPKGSRPLSIQSLDKLLRNPLYSGWITSSWGIMVRGGFEPLIDDDLFRRVEERLTGRGAPGQTRSLNNADFPLNVIVRCGACGKGITGSLATGRKGRRYPHYFCRTRGCRAVKFRRDELHRHFIELLYSLTPKDALIPLFRATVMNVWQEKNANQEQSNVLSDQRKTELEDRRKRIIDAMLDGRLDQKMYDDQMVRVGTALEAIHNGAEKTIIAKEELVTLLEFAEWMLERVAGIWNSAAIENKKRIQAALFPDGLTVTPTGFGTASNPSFFTEFEPVPVEETGLASPGGFEPPLPP
jgi:site-specific DNA recombinase